MKMLRSLIIVAVIITGFFGVALAIEGVVNDFDGDTWGGWTWGGGYDSYVATAEVVSTYNHPPVAGNSLHIYWNYTGAATRWGGGNVSNFLGTDISTYSALSFWIYTPNANTNVNVQIQDAAAFGNNMGRVKLRDYMVTKVNTWQNVVIPLDAFRRNNPNMVFKMNEVKWMSEYDQGNDTSGEIYVDDIKFLLMPDAPALSLLYSGDDMGVANTADVSGDTLMVWDQAISSMTSNQVSVTVSTGYACAWASVPADKGTVQGTTTYFSYQIRNDGNAADSIVFSSQVVQGSTWPFTVIWDKDKSGTYSVGDIPYDNAIGLAPASTHYFLVGVYIPNSAVLWSSSTIRITAKDKNGAGTEDNWPGAGNDTISDDFIAIASNTATGVLITVSRSTATASGSDRPGDTITYTIHYPNIGDTAGTGMIITEAIPFNTILVSANQQSADTLQYYVGGAWGGFDATATRVRWIDNSVPSVSNLSVDYTVKVKYGQGNTFEETAANFDTGSDPINIGGGTWCGGGGAGTAFGSNGYSSVNHTPNAGYSMHYWWGNVIGGDDWAGGVLTNLGGIDVSTYSALSFWIYTPNANTNLNVQIQDAVEFGNDMGRVPLQDYLITGTSVWQNVIIPLDAFRRNNYQLDLKIKEVKWMAEASQTNDPSGNIYIDDVKFLKMSQAPARSRIVSGVDKGTATVVDMPGDSFAYWSQQGSSTTFAENVVRVSTGYAVAWSSIPADKGTIHGTTTYFPYQIRNEGNSSDKIYFSSSVVEGSTWPVTIYWDKDKSSTYSNGDIPVGNSFGVEPNCTYYFLAGVYIPGSAVLWSSSTIRITAKDNNGLGTEDNWPAAGNDTIFDNFIAIASNSVAGVFISVARSSATVSGSDKPGDTLKYVINYPNSGDTAGTDMIITEAIPFNTVLVSADKQNADSVNYYVSGAWQPGFDDSATKVRFIHSSVNAASNYYVEYTVKVKNSGNPVEYTVADLDSGSNPINAGGNTWGNTYGDYSTNNHLPSPGYSLELRWSYTDPDWGGGGFSGMSLDVSSFSALSFWIYTPNADTNMNVQLQDMASYGEETGKVQLRDYLITGTSVWQNVIIPLAEFKRNEMNLDFHIKELKWIAESSMSNDTSGRVYIDDVKFLNISQAPALSRIISGSDKGIANAADMPGDSFAWWTQQGSSSTFAEMTVRVSTNYAVAFTSVPINAAAASAGDYYFAYSACNNGNKGTEYNITAATTTTAGQSFTSVVYWDKDKNGVYGAGDIVTTKTKGLEPGTTDYFIVKVNVPSSFSGGQPATIKVLLDNNASSATNYFNIELSTKYAAAFTQTPSQTSQTIQPDTTAYFRYVIRNDGNVSDVFSVAVASISGLGQGTSWNVWITSDSNKNGVHDSSENNVVTSNIPLSPGASFFCFVSVYVPIANTGRVTARITVKDQNGTGLPDTGDDTITSDVILISAVDNTAPVITTLSAPPSKVGMFGNTMLFKTEVADDESLILGVTFYYEVTKKAGKTSFAKIVTATSTIYSVDLKDTVTESCTIQYSWAAENQWHYAAVTSTGTTAITQITESDNFTSGKLTVDDGNPDDGNTSIDIPAGALTAPIDLTIEQNVRTDVQAGNSPANSDYPSTVYDFKGNGGKDVIFNKPVTLTMLFMDTNKDGVEDYSSKDERTMRVFWWDGYEWRLIGGRVDILNNTVTVKVMHLSRYAVFPIKSLTAADYRAKERILTPAGSPGKNDFCQFGVSGDNVKINIYDINGSRVKELKDGANMWDGKDEDSQIVESGVYIYQIKAGNELISGTILIIK